MSDAFYDIVKKWTVNDYRTPGIKAEVILDMLLSPFVADILTKKAGKQFILLTKEFPIRPLGDNKTESGKDSFRNAKVDYLLACPEEDALYLAELKTTRESVDWPQVDRMVNAKTRENPVGDLFLFYEGVKAHSEQKEKYAWQEKKLFDRKKSAKCPKDYSFIRLAYLTLGSDEKIIKKLLDKDKEMVITSLLAEDLYTVAPDSDQKSDQKRILWTYVYEILRECTYPEPKKSTGL